MVDSVTLDAMSASLKVALTAAPTATPVAPAAGVCAGDRRGRIGAVGRHIAAASAAKNA